MEKQVRLSATGGFALAYNPGNFLRRLALPKRVKEWSLRTLRIKLIKIGAKVVKVPIYRDNFSDGRGVGFKKVV